MYKMNNQSKFELRKLFKDQLDVGPDYNSVGSAQYRCLTHFAWVKEIKENIPGTWSMYCMHAGGIAIATNAIDINFWCDAHQIPRRRQLSDKVVAMKIKANGTDKIDNRTPESVIQYPGREQRRQYASRYKQDPLMNIREKVKDMYFGEAIPAGEIAYILHVTPPAIYYHIKKIREEMEADLVDS